MYLDFSESLALVINQVYSSTHLKFLLVTTISSKHWVPTLLLRVIKVFVVFNRLRMSLKDKLIL